MFEFSRARACGRMRLCMRAYTCAHRLRMPTGTRLGRPRAHSHMHEYICMYAHIAPTSYACMARHIPASHSHTRVHHACYALAHEWTYPCTHIPLHLYTCIRHPHTPHSCIHLCTCTIHMRTHIITPACIRSMCVSACRRIRVRPYKRTPLLPCAYPYASIHILLHAYISDHPLARPSTLSSGHMYKSAQMLHT